MEDWYGPDTATFGDRVCAAREAAGMDRDDLARKMGVKKSTLKQWEEDLSEPRANKLQMMAGLLGVSITWLLNGEGEGIGSPDDVEELPSDMVAVLSEIREVQTTLKSQSERLARLEKKLRRSLAEV